MADRGPAWIQEQTSNDEASSIRGQSLDKRQMYFYWALKVVTMGGCILMATTASLGIKELHGIDGMGKIFIALFMFLFAGMLFLFEASQVYPCENIDHAFKRNFGFLYSAKGKAFYIVFIAFLSFGLDEPANLCVGTGVFMALFGIAQIVVYLKWPELYQE